MKTGHFSIKKAYIIPIPATYIDIKILIEKDLPGYHLHKSSPGRKKKEVQSQEGMTNET